MDTTWVLLAVCLGASSSRWINDINLWVVGAPTERWGRGTAAPQFPRLVDEALGARALYLDALGSLFYDSSLHPHLQHSVLKAGVDLALVGALRQRHAPSERTIAALPDMVVTTILFFVDLVLTGDGEDSVLQRDVHIVLLETRKLGTDHQVGVLGEYVHGRRPLAELSSSLTPPPATQAPQHLIEEAIHLTLHVVKPTERTQHDPYTSFPSLAPQIGTDLPSLRDHYISSNTVFKHFYRQIYRFFLVDT